MVDIITCPVPYAAALDYRKLSVMDENSIIVLEVQINGTTKEQRKMIAQNKVDKFFFEKKSTNELICCINSAFDNINNDNLAQDGFDALALLRERLSTAIWKRDEAMLL